MGSVVLRSVEKRFGGVTVLRGVDLAISTGEFIVLVGPSGCGKSTLLRMIAGLEEISGGDLIIDGIRANHVPPEKRNIAMVFQSYALFPHYTARDNMAFGPKLRGEPMAGIADRIAKAARMLDLTAYLDRKPFELSGGQRQRVAMGRAIVREPSLFLFDEPLSNLDAQLRVSMRVEIKALHQKLANTIVYVTHDQVEAMTLADRIVVMNSGRIEQEGPPLALYDRPTNLFVARFLGSPAMGLIEGRYNSAGFVVTHRATRIPVAAVGAADGARVVLGIRPEHAELGADGIPAQVELVEAMGPETLVHVVVDGARLTISTRQRLAVRPGEAVAVRLSADHTHVFLADTGVRVG